MKTAYSILLITLLLLIPTVKASEDIEYTFSLDFEDGTLNEWDFTDSDSSANVTVTNDTLRITGNYSCLSSSGGGGQAQTRLNITEGTDYIAEFDIRYKELDNWLVYDQIRTPLRIYAAITPYSSGYFQVGYLNGSDTTWKNTTYKFDDNSTYPVYHVKIILNVNNVTGSAIFIVNNTLIAQYTGLSNGLYGYPNQFFTLGQAGGGSDAYVFRDNIEIEVSEPFDANFWFIIAGVITFFFVSGFALFALKGRIRR